MSGVRKEERDGITALFILPMSQPYMGYMGFIHMTILAFYIKGVDHLNRTLSIPPIWNILTMTLNLSEI